MFLWNAYQIELEAFGPGNTVTARDCNQNTVPRRRCTFNEFIKNIEMTRNNPGFAGVVDVRTISLSPSTIRFLQ
jgi:hypothetical protein